VAEMASYAAVGAYLGVTLIVFVLAILWNKYRKTLKRKLHIEEYRYSGSDEKHLVNHG
jgi:hypothetical protein